ncbi:transcription initiation factor TFIID subunit 11, partial [Linderina macrospora]
MPNDPTSSTPASGATTPHVSTQPPKKRSRPILTPAAILRQKRKRGGTTVTGRKPTARSGTATPIKSKGAAPPDTTSLAEKLKKRTPLPTGDEETEVEEEEEEEILGDDEITLVKQSKEEVRELWDQLSEEQQQRYGVYRRTALSKSAVRRLASSVLGQQISPTLSFVIAGFSKVFVGEIVERAVAIQGERGDQGPLTPAHLREAYRQYKKEAA